ncbi:MAG: hypothetical protein RR539_00115 [Clostridium sp.]|uniref:hypothetical protein n=1 Tax=Clostridium sp. TaxID=1506 RepID=UPI002FC7527A
MYFPLNEDISSNLEHIALNLSYMSTRCTEWAVLYSGLGIYNHISNKELKRFYSHFKIKPDDRDTDLIYSIKCMYKKGRPEFLKALKSSKRDRKYLWRSDTYSRELPILSQAFTILSLCSISSLIKRHEKFLSVTMLKNADSIFDFLVKNMKSGEGHFVSYEDKTASHKEDLTLKRIDKHPDLICQIYLHEGFLMLYSETNNVKYRHYFKNSELYLEESRKLFRHLFEGRDYLISLKSKDLSSVISSLYRCYSIETEESYKEEYLSMITLLSLELESRVSSDGNVERSNSDDASSSMITHFKTLGALIEGYFITGLYPLRSASNRLFKYLNDRHDPLSGLFMRKSEYKLRYTSKDAAEVIKSLTLYNVLENDKTSLNLLKAFYKTSIEEANLFASTKERNPEFLSHTLKIPDNIPLYEQNKKAPVFLKGFKVNTKKSHLPITCRGFNSYYGLYSSFIYTLYFKPIIEYKKLSQGEVSERSNEFVEDIYYNILNRNFEDIEEYDITDDDTINEVSTTIDSKNNIDDPDENIG